MTRRQFVATTAGTAAGFAIIPRHALGAGMQAPSDTVNLAVVGGGGRGAAVATELLTGRQNIVALADIDMAGLDARIARSTRNAKGEPNEARVRLQQAYAKATRYTDFRRMLERQKDIDAVLIATPDHTHAVIAKAAMEMGKHVYVEKPLTWSVQEARVLRELASRSKLVTQMGNQGASTNGARLINEWIQAGIIGPVREVNIYTDRPIWPQGVPRPAGYTDAAQRGQTPGAAAQPVQGGGSSEWSRDRVAKDFARALGGQYSTPAGLDWDLFLGPAPEVPYHPIYHPFNWRGWIDWGVGAVGDIAAHTLNHAWWALGLTYPTTVEATSTPFGLDEKGQAASYPAAMEVTFRFAAEGTRPAVKFTWRDGGLMAPRHEMLPDNVTLPRAGSVIIVGDKGILVHQSYGNNPKLYPESLMEAAAKVPQKYDRVPGELHAMNWADAIKGRQKATSPFEVSSRVTEVMLLGIVAIKAGQGKQIRYDGQTGTVTNDTVANQLLGREYRRGWTL